MNSQNAAIAKEYRERLITQYRRVDFRGIMQVRHMVSFEIEELYVPSRAVSGLPDYSPSVGRPYDGEGDDDATSESRMYSDELDRLNRTINDGESIELAAAFRGGRRLIVLGDPGTGKSTFAKWLALTFAAGSERVRERLGVEEDRFPILVSVAAYANAFRDKDTDSLIPLTVEEFAATCVALIHPAARKVAEHALASGAALLLLDGLDEVLNVGDRIEASRRIETFADNCHEDTRLVMTSRIAGYRLASFAGKTPHVTLTGFGREEVDQFALNWARSYERQEGKDNWETLAEERAASLTKAIHGTPQIERLASNPLLVTILALVHHQGAELPRRRVDLYKVCVEALAEHWQKGRQTAGPAVKLMLRGAPIDYRFVADTLGPIAFDLMRRGVTSLITRDELESRVADQLVDLYGETNGDAGRQAHEFIDLIHEHSGLLTERGPDLYDFLHQTFKEYLAAHYLAQADDPLDLLGEQVHAPRLLEVVLLAAASMGAPRATRFVMGLLDRSGEYDDLLQRPLVLACRCLSDDITVEAPARQAVLAAATDLFAKEDQAWRAEPALSQVVEHAAGGRFAEQLATALIDPLRNGNTATQNAVMGLLGRLGAAPAEVTEALAARLGHEDAGVRSEAANMLVGLEVRDDRVVSALIALLEDEDASVRVQAAVTLVGLEVRDDRVVSALIALLEHKEVGVRYQAANTLVGQEVRDDRVVDALIALLEHEAASVRVQAAVTLVDLEVHDDRVVSALIALLEDEDASVRVQAAVTLVDLEVRDDRVVSAIIALLEDEDASVRYQAASTLVGLEVRDDRVVSALIALLEHKEAGVRYQAANTLVGLEVRDDRVVSALIALLEHKEAGVRYQAANTLVRLEVRDDRVVSALIALLEDEDARVRGGAASTLVGLEVRDDRVVSALIALLEDEDGPVRYQAASTLVGLEVRDDRVVDTLLDLLEHKTAFFGRVAARTLQSLCPLNAGPLADLAARLRRPGEVGRQSRGLGLVRASVDALADRLTASEAEVV